MTKDQYKAGLEKMLNCSKEERIFLAEHSFGLFALYYFSNYFQYSLAPYHYDFIDDLHDLTDGKIREVAWIAFRESAKRQPLTANLMTPNGYTKLGKLKVGDKVIGSNGKATDIIFMSPIVKRPIYEIRTEDGRSTECDSEHLWTVRKMTNVKTKYETISTQEILDKGLFYDRLPDKRNGKKYKEYKFALDTVKPVELKEKELTIEPYFLGVWLGDGSSADVRITNIEPEIEHYLEEYANKLNLKYKKVLNKERTPSLVITGNRGGGHSLQKKLKDIGVLNNKHIPDDYLYGSIDQRKALLEGLMDTDGTVSSGTASFCNTNENLVDGVVSLVRSLGGRAKKVKTKTFVLYKGERKECVCWKVSILLTDYTPFRVVRKIKNHKLSKETFSRIVSIEYKREDLGRCIKVSNEDGLYVTDDYLLTHNTTFSKLFIMWMISYNKKRYICVDSFDRENAERILFDIAYELTNNARLSADYPTLFSKRRAIHEIKQNRINNFVTENGIRVEAHSTQESVRGRIHLNQRPAFLLLDDIETNKTKDSQAYTKQVKDHISEAMAGLSPDGCILYLGNFITEYGNIQYIFDRAKTDKGIRVRNIPVMVDGLPTWDSKYALTDDEAKKTGKVSIEDKQRQLGSFVFSYEMMNKPVDDTLSEFKKDHVQIVTEEEVRKKDTNCYITIDSAVSEKESADFTGITINRVDMQNKWYIYSYRLKVNTKELIEHLFYLHKTYSPKMIGLEETTFTMAIQPFLQDEMRKRHYPFSVTALKHKGIQKETRIRGLIPRWENNGIFLIGSHLELLDEMRTFPRGQNDDVLDSLSHQLHNAHRPFYAPDFESNKPEINNAI